LATRSSATAPPTCSLGLGGADVLDGGGPRRHGDLRGVGVGRDREPDDGHGSGGDAEGDTLVRIESLIGSAQDDMLTGNGFDTAWPAATATTCCGVWRAGTRYSATPATTRSKAVAVKTPLLAGDGDDTLDGGAGADAMTGGGGSGHVQGRPRRRQRDRDSRNGHRHGAGIAELHARTNVEN